MHVTFGAARRKNGVVFELASGLWTIVKRSECYEQSWQTIQDVVEL